MATLGQLASQVCDALNRHTDWLLHERVKDLIIQERNLLLHRQFDKTGTDEEFIIPYTAQLILVNRSLDSNIPTNLTLLRTQNKVPGTIRRDSDVPFYFVGSPDHDVIYGYIKAHTMSYITAQKLIGSAIKYCYLGGYIYIINNTKIESVLIEDVFENPYIELTGVTSNSLCYMDDEDFPAPSDMLNTIVNSIINNLRAGNDLQSKGVTSVQDIN